VQFNIEKNQFKHEILPLLKGVDKSAIICDVGCGSGSMLSVLADAGYINAFGVDVSPEQVELAKDMGVSKVHCQDFFEYIKENEVQCDVVLGMDIIEHFTKTELVGFLKKMRESLKPKGRVLFRTPNLDAPMATVFAHGDFTHENYINQSSAEQVMLSCGFTKVRVLPSLMRTGNPLKEFFRKMVYAVMRFRLQLLLFATARSTKGVLFSPNLVIEARK
jgi:SAM-dependent methyltransferase